MKKEAIHRRTIHGLKGINLLYLGDVIKIHPYTQDEANEISYIKLEMYIFKCNMKIEDVHKISRRVDDPHPKNPLVVKIKLLYIRLVHNLGRDNCT